MLVFLNVSYPEQDLIGQNRGGGLNLHPAGAQRRITFYIRDHVALAAVAVDGDHLVVPWRMPRGGPGEKPDRVYHTRLSEPDQHCRPGLSISGIPVARVISVIDVGQAAVTDRGRLCNKN